MANEEDPLVHEEGEKGAKSARISPKTLVIVIISTIFDKFVIARIAG